jgi:ABC-type Fe3+-siderophore transport system permease subunit
MDELFPTQPEGLLNPLIAAVAAQLVALWLASYLKDWRWKDLLCLAITCAVMLAATLTQPLPGGEGVAGSLGVRVFSALWLGFVGASAATFGYETVMNLLGVINRGPRATEAVRQTLGKIR